LQDRSAKSDDLRHKCGLLPAFLRYSKKYCLFHTEEPRCPTRAARQLNEMSPNLLFSVVLVAAASLAWPGDENFIWTSGYCRQDGDANKECEGIDCSTVGRGTDEWCAARCNEDPSCVAWDNCGNSCWLHGAPRSTGVGGAGCECWVKGVLDRFVHIPAACVSGNNIELHKGKTVTECAAICDANPSCLAFGYGVDHGGSGTYYEAGDCQEQSSAEDIVYDCTNHNLDLYVKDIVYVDQPTSQPGSSSSSSSGYVMDDSTLRTAVDAWLSDATAAEATYGHISTWQTGGVTDMSELFETHQTWPEAHPAESFNEDIGAWDTSGVTDMSWMFAAARSTQKQDVTHGMFHGASRFNQDIGGWAVDRVTNMMGMFAGASAFDQDISSWAVGRVRNMEKMFYYTAAFNQDLGAWDISGVTTMYWMFYSGPHNGARARSVFDQDLGWCIRDGVDIENAFKLTKCEETSCGVAMQDVFGICEPWAHPCLIGTDKQCDINSPSLIIIIVLVLLVGFGACVCCRKKKDETYAAAAWRILCDCIICCCL